MEVPYTPKEEHFADARGVNALAEMYEILASRPHDVEIHEMVIDAWQSIGDLGNFIPPDMHFGVVLIVFFVRSSLRCGRSAAHNRPNQRKG
jgi:hypothetical protein